VNLLSLAKWAVHRDDRVSIYHMAQRLAAFNANSRVSPPLVLQLKPATSVMSLQAVDHRLRTWTFYTSWWYWKAANHYRMGIRDIRRIPGRTTTTGVWLTKDMARKANEYTTRSKAAGRPEPKDKPWDEWWQSFKHVHRLIIDAATAAVAEEERAAALLWADVYGLLERCRLAADRGATWPREPVRLSSELPAKERPVPEATPVASMAKKGRPNRICADGVERFRYSRSYRAVAITLGLGQLDPSGHSVWLAEGAEHRAVATAVKAKNIQMDISLS